MTDAHDLSRRTVLKTIGGGLATGTALAGTGAAQVPRNHGLNRELAQVRSATAAYNDTQHALEAGYLPEQEAVCGMGYHWPNPDLLDFQVTKTEPEAVVYGASPGGNLVLGAVEYVAPKAGPFQTSSPDSPFENADPDWGTLEVPQDAPIPFDQLWTLHAWVHNHNPEGVFHPTNPRKLFHPDGCVDHGDH